MTHVVRATPQEAASLFQKIAEAQYRDKVTIVGHLHEWARVNDVALDDDHIIRAANALFERGGTGWVSRRAVLDPHYRPSIEKAITKSVRAAGPRSQLGQREQALRNAVAAARSQA